MTFDSKFTDRSFETEAERNKFDADYQAARKRLGAARTDSDGSEYREDSDRTDAQDRARDRSAGAWRKPLSMSK